MTMNADSFKYDDDDEEEIIVAKKEKRKKKPRKNPLPTDDDLEIRSIDDEEIDLSKKTIFQYVKQINRN